MILQTNVRTTLFGVLFVVLLSMSFGVGSAFAEKEASFDLPSKQPLIPILSEAEEKRYDEIFDNVSVLRKEIASYHEPFDEETKKLITEKEAKIEEFLKEADQLYSLPPLVEISPEREAELTMAMWMMAWTNYPFVTMGIESHTGAIGITMDETKIDVNDREGIEDVLRGIVGDGITLNIYYAENLIKFQGSWSGPLSWIPLFAII